MRPSPNFAFIYFGAKIGYFLILTKHLFGYFLILKKLNIMSTAERLKEYLKFKGIKNNTAENMCGLSNGYIANSKSIGSDKLENILTTFQDLSAEWLLRGTGKMLISDGIDPAQVFRALNMPPNSQKIIDVWLKFMEVTEGMQEIYKQSM